MTSPDALRQLYALTPVEARVAIAVADGRRVAEIAATLRMTPSTVRWYIKQARAKLGVTTQAQMVRVVMSGPDLGPAGIGFPQSAGFDVVAVTAGDGS
jgi:DNA-binding CsgD family transcriptional regulator